jgi:hypothetical protein
METTVRYDIWKFVTTSSQKRAKLRDTKFRILFRRLYTTVNTEICHDTTSLEGLKLLNYNHTRLCKQWE